MSEKKLAVSDLTHGALGSAWERQNYLSARLNCDVYACLWTSRAVNESSKR